MSDARFNAYMCLYKKLGMRIEREIYVQTSLRKRKEDYGPKKYKMHQR